MKDIYSLPYCFFYEWKDDLDFFLDNNTLNNDIYDQIIERMNNYPNGNTPFVDAVKVFNQAIILCMRVVHDKHPENAFRSKYEPNYKDYDDCEMLSNLTACVYLNIYNNLYSKRNVERFLKQMELTDLFCNIQYYGDFDTLISMSKGDSRRFENNLPSFESKIQLPSSSKYDVDWKHVTDEFDEQSIREIVQLWETKEEQLETLDCIERAFDYYELHKYELPF